MVSEETCTLCQKLKPASQFPRPGPNYRPHCKTCRIRQSVQKWREHSPTYQRRWILSTYGLTPEMYEELLAAQGGVCAMCGKVCSTGRRLAIDHDHETGQVRGLLCNSCNRKLGAYESIRTQADEYLAKKPVVTAFVVNPRGEKK